MPRAPKRASKPKPASTTAAQAQSGRRTNLPPVDLGKAVVEAFLTNERMNQFLLEHIDARAWAASPPLVKEGAGRTIAAIVAHMHNVRGMWLKVSAKGTSIPVKLDRRTVRPSEARCALSESAEAIRLLLERSIEAGGRVKEFRPDVVGFLGYLVAHEAHHRGQICMMTRQLGHPLSQEANFGLWDWAKRWKESVPER